ncbi:hypothetical protein BDQ17DRAFT_1408880 [Cyathus striatus]|nr:hypothetical protein BDQ17DRAFT_1408880 [Cyathus striatus]
MSETSFFFPPEIEDEIFQWAAYCYPYLPTDAHLAVVSKRVQSCIEPVLYETLIFPGIKFPIEKKFANTLQSKSPSFFHRNVKNLHISRSLTQKFLSDVLSVCTGVHNLAIYVSVADSTTWKHISTMPLRSLECHHDILDTLLEKRHIFPKLTYLSLQSSLDERPISSNAFKCLPALNQIAIRVENCNSAVLKNLRVALETVPRLGSIIVFLHEYYAWGNDASDETIHNWLELDKKIEIIDSPLMPDLLWSERVKTGKNDFEGYQFRGHCSDYDESSDSDDYEYEDE